jgi:hypothetical protein
MGAMLLPRHSPTAAAQLISTVCNHLAVIPVAWIPKPVAWIPKSQTSIRNAQDALVTFEPYTQHIPTWWLQRLHDGLAPWPVCICCQHHGLAGLSCQLGRLQVGCHTHQQAHQHRWVRVELLQACACTAAAQTGRQQQEQ